MGSTFSTSWYGNETLTMKKNGQAIIETVLFLPLFIIILLAITWYSRIFITRQQLLLAARYGTDLIVHANFTEQDIRTEIMNFLTDKNIKGRKLESDKVKIKIEIGNVPPPPSFNPPTSYVEVYYKFELPVWFGTDSKFWVSARSEVLNDSYTTFFDIPNGKNHS